MNAAQRGSWGSRCPPVCWAAAAVQSPGPGAGLGRRCRVANHAGMDGVPWQGGELLQSGNESNSPRAQRSGAQAHAGRFLVAAGQRCGRQEQAEEAREAPAGHFVFGVFVGVWASVLGAHGVLNVHKSVAVGLQVRQGAGRGLHLRASAAHSRSAPASPMSHRTAARAPAPVIGAVQQARPPRNARPSERPSPLDCCARLSAPGALLRCRSRPMMCPWPSSRSGEPRRWTRHSPRPL